MNPERYREICVGFTPGWLGLREAIASLEKVVIGIPDLHARIDDVAAEGDRVYARLTVTGTNSGRSYEASMFDYARIENGGIDERIQQSDTLSQLEQMYAGATRKAAAGLLSITALLALRTLRRRCQG